MALPHLTDQTVAGLHGTGTVLDQGAQVLRWAPRGHEPVLWVSPQAVFEAGRSVRGGIPVCWPWFGPGLRPGLSPQHGFVRTATWTHVGTDVDGDEVVVRHEVTEAEASSEHFPHPYRLIHEARFGAALTTSLTTVNPGTEAWALEAALHTYLVVSDVREVSLDGLDGASYFDKVSGERRRQEGPVRFTGPTDRVYAAAGPVTLTDPGLGRAIRVTRTGCANVVVWNPWAAGAAQIADVPTDGWPGFVCVEAANALDDAVTLEPGESVTMTNRLDVEEL